jgi:ribosomal protein S18 acetylase RimI-like enzyme
MIRENLEGLPHFAPPVGFSLRWYRQGDEAVWVALQAPFYDPGAVHPALFRAQYGTDEAELARRMLFAVAADGQPVGTVTAWSYDGYRGPEWGRIHWLAVAEQRQGQGLGKALISAACVRLAELGHTKAYLTTSRERPNAVALYRAFGFCAL